MDGHTSPARFLAYHLAEHDVSVSQLCDRSGLDSDIVRAFLTGRLPVRWPTRWASFCTPPDSGSPGRHYGAERMQGTALMVTVRSCAKLSLAGTG